MTPLASRKMYWTPPSGLTPIKTQQLRIKNEWGLNRAPEFCQALIQQFLIEELALATDPVGILAARQVKDVREIPGILIVFAGWTTSDSQSFVRAFDAVSCF